jgi:hypothetical protein
MYYVFLKSMLIKAFGRLSDAQHVVLDLLDVLNEHGGPNVRIEDDRGQLIEEWFWSNVDAIWKRNDR